MKKKSHLIISILVVIIFSIFTVGYAALSSDLNFFGNVLIMRSTKEIKITAVTLIDSKNLVSGQIPTFSNTQIDFDLSFNSDVNPKKDQTYYAEYQVTLLNETYYSYTYDTPTFNLQTDASHQSTVSITKTVSGINVGDTIAPGAQVIYTIKIEIDPTKNDAPYPVTGSYITNLTIPTTGQLVGSIPAGSTGDVTNNQIASFTATVINSFASARTFTLESTKTDFSVTNSTGGAIGNFTISAGETKTVTFYVKNNIPSGYVTSPQNLPIRMTSSGLSNQIIGSVNLIVPIDPNLVDTDPPVISNVTITQSTTPYNATLTWAATDDNTISSFTIITYKETSGSFSEVSRTTTAGTARSYNLSGLSESTYYFTVFGTDSLGNTASSTDIANATTLPGFATCSSNITFDWYASVTFSISNMTAYDSNNQNITNGTTTLLNQSFSFRLSTSGMYNLPSSITIRINGTILGTDKYTYSSSTGQAVINSVTGDVSVEGTASCLVEGTKILLANGRYKNVEDVGYYDLLAVWNYKEGKKGYAYPIWILSAGQANEYLKSSFSDGSYLKTVDTHSIFDVGKNQFISIDDIDFTVGNKVAKVDKNGNLYSVELIKQEKVSEFIKYYHIITSYNHNVISNDFITTDGNAFFANVYQFDNNMKWNGKEMSLAKKGHYTYDDFKDLIPYGLYEGLRLKEASYFKKYLDLDTFKYYINESVIKNHHKSPVYDKDGNRIWLVTISTEDINQFIDKSFKKEATYYIFPIKKDVKFYLDASNGEKYFPGDKIKIYYSRHFIAIK